MPEGTIDVIPVDLVVGAICAVAGPRARAGAADRAGCIRLDEPTALPRPRRPRARVVQRAPALRQRRATDRRRSMVVPRPRQGARAAQPGQAAARAGREGVHSAAGARRSRTGARSPGGAPVRGGASAELRRAVRRLRRVRGHLPRRPPHGCVAQPRRRGSHELRVRPARHRLDVLRDRGPSAVRRAARRACERRPEVARARHATSGCAPRCSHPVVISPRSTSRTRSSRRTWSSRTRGSQADASTATTGCG